MPGFLCFRSAMANTTGIEDNGQTGEDPTVHPSRRQLNNSVPAGFAYSRTVTSPSESNAPASGVIYQIDDNGGPLARSMHRMDFESRVEVGAGLEQRYVVRYCTDGLLLCLDRGWNFVCVPLTAETVYISAWLASSGVTGTNVLQRSIRITTKV